MSYYVLGKTKAYEVHEDIIFKAHDAYFKVVEGEARKYFIKHVVPLCVKKNWNFKAAMGDYVFYEMGKEGKTIDLEENGYRHLEHDLLHSISGMGSSCFGSLMPSFVDGSVLGAKLQERR